MGQYYRQVCVNRRESLYTHAFGDGLKLMEFGCSGSGTMSALTLLLLSRDVSDEIFGAGPKRHIGSWAKDPANIVITGDYADPNWFSDEDRKRMWEKESYRKYHEENDAVGTLDTFETTLYSVASELYSDISTPLAEEVNRLMGDASPFSWIGSFSGPWGLPDAYWDHQKFSQASLGDGPDVVIWNVSKSQLLDPGLLHPEGKRGLFTWMFTPDGPTPLLALLLAEGNGRGGGDLFSNNPIIGSWAGDWVIVLRYSPDGDYGTDITEWSVEALMDDGYVAREDYWMGVANRLGATKITQ